MGILAKMKDFFTNLVDESNGARLMMNYSKSIAITTHDDFIANHPDNSLAPDGKRDAQNAQHQIDAQNVNNGLYAASYSIYAGRLSYKTATYVYQAFAKHKDRKALVSEKLTTLYHKDQDLLDWAADEQNKAEVNKAFYRLLRKKNNSAWLQKQSLNKEAQFKLFLFQNAIQQQHKRTLNAAVPKVTKASLIAGFKKALITNDANWIARFNFDVHEQKALSNLRNRLLGKEEKYHLEPAQDADIERALAQFLNPYLGDDDILVEQNGDFEVALPSAQDLAVFTDDEVQDNTHLPVYTQACINVLLTKRESDLEGNESAIECRQRIGKSGGQLMQLEINKVNAAFWPFFRNDGIWTLLNVLTGGTHAAKFSAALDGIGSIASSLFTVVVGVAMLVDALLAGINYWAFKDNYRLEKKALNDKYRTLYADKITEDTRNEVSKRLVFETVVDEQNNTQASKQQRSYDLERAMLKNTKKVKKGSLHRSVAIALLLASAMIILGLTGAAAIVASCALSFMVFNAVSSAYTTYKTYQRDLKVKQDFDDRTGGDLDKLCDAGKAFYKKQFAPYSTNELNRKFASAKKAYTYRKMALAVGIPLLFVGASVVITIACAALALAPWIIPLVMASLAVGTGLLSVMANSTHDQYYANKIQTYAIRDNLQSSEQHAELNQKVVNSNKWHRRVKIAIGLFSAAALITGIGLTVGFLAIPAALGAGAIVGVMAAICGGVGLIFGIANKLNNFLHNRKLKKHVDNDKEIELAEIITKQEENLQLEVDNVDNVELEHENQIVDNEQENLDNVIPFEPNTGNAGLLTQYGMFQEVHNMERQNTHSEDQILVRSNNS